MPWKSFCCKRSWCVGTPFVWRNSGRQKETSYIRRCQAKIRTWNLRYSLNVTVISHSCKKCLLEDCEVLYFGSKQCSLVGSAVHRLHRPAPPACVDSIKTCALQDTVFAQGQTSLLQQNKHMRYGCETEGVQFDPSRSNIFALILPRPPQAIHIKTVTCN